MWDPLLDEIFDGVLDGDAEYVIETVQRALSAGVDPVAVLCRGLVAAAIEVSDLYREGEYREEEVYAAAEAIQGALAALKPAMATAPEAIVAAVFKAGCEGDRLSPTRELALTILQRAGIEVPLPTVSISLATQPMKSLLTRSEPTPSGSAVNLSGGLSFAA